MESTPNQENLKVKIELADPNDAEEIQNVLYKTWLATYPGTVPGVSTDDVHEYYKERLSAEAIEKSRKRIEKELNLENQRFSLQELMEK